MFIYFVLFSDNNFHSERDQNMHNELAESKAGSCPKEFGFLVTLLLLDIERRRGEVWLYMTRKQVNFPVKLWSCGYKCSIQYSVY